MLITCCHYIFPLFQSNFGYYTRPQSPQPRLPHDISDTMANSTSADGDMHLNSTARYSLRKRPEYSPTSNQSVESNLQAPLLHLPGELRTKIFKYALGGMHIVHGDFRGHSTWATVVHTTSGVSVSWQQGFRFTLPRVCRQVYSETATLVYSQNIFHFPSIRSFDYFFPPRKRAQIEAITTLVVEPLWAGHLDGKVCLVQILGRLLKLTGLRKLYLNRYQGLTGSKRIFDLVREAEAAVAEGLAGDLEVVFVTLQGVGTEIRTILP